MWGAFSVFLEGWATAASGAVGSGLEDMRHGVELLRRQNVLLFDGLLKIGLAEAENRAGDPVLAVAILDEALAMCDRTGYRQFEAELYRVRGEMLLKSDPAKPAAAEEALRSAIGVAKRQSTRSFELRAALSLAKLYQSTGRPVEAHAVLAPALEGFSPTPECARSRKGAVRASHRRPAMKACVFQCPNGTFESSLCPLRLRPRRRAILVVVPVSSRKTSRCGSSRMVGWRVRSIPRAPALCWGRSCSLARRVFFEAIADANEPP